jgi:hypothetical protein
MTSVIGRSPGKITLSGYPPGRRYVGEVLDVPAEAVDVVVDQERVDTLLRHPHPHLAPAPIELLLGCRPAHLLGAIAYRHAPARLALLVIRTS